MNWQQIAVIVTLGYALSWLLRWTWKSTRKSKKGCGTGCGCGMSQAGKKLKIGKAVP